MTLLSYIFFRLFNFFYKRKVSLINPRLLTIDEIKHYVDLNRQPTKSIVVRSHFRALQNVTANKTMGETPILNALKLLEKKHIFGTDQLPYLHGDGICGNMYTQHPDRLIPFWLRCKEMNLISLFYTMFSFPDNPDLTTRPLITQCFIDIIANLKEVDAEHESKGHVDANTESDFVAYRRVEDMRHHMKFLQNGFNKRKKSKIFF